MSLSGTIQCAIGAIFGATATTHVVRPGHASRALRSHQLIPGGLASSAVVGLVLVEGSVAILLVGSATTGRGGTIPAVLGLVVCCVFGAYSAFVIRNNDSTVSCGCGDSEEEMSAATITRLALMALLLSAALLVEALPSAGHEVIASVAAVPGLAIAVWVIGAVSVFPTRRL